MELTEEQRAKLRSIREAGNMLELEQDGQDLIRGGSKDTYGKRRKKLKALMRAWDNIDHLTQIDISIAISRISEGASCDTTLPDFRFVIANRIEQMKKADHRPQKRPGLREAIEFLWVLWCGSPEGQEVQIDPAAIAAISEEIAAEFNIEMKTAKQRVEKMLWNLDGTGQLRRRKGFSEDRL